MKMFIIIEDNIPIGFFQNSNDRDIAFIEHIIKKHRYGVKGYKEV